MKVKTEPLHILENPRRRAFITVLRDLGGKACLREIVARIAEGEGLPRGEERYFMKSIHISMLQTHLPKMERAGLIEYDHVTGVVRLLELPPEYKYYLEAVKSGDIPWHAYYLALSVSGAALSLFFGNLLATAIAASFLAASLFHTFQVDTVNGPLTRAKHKLTKYPARLRRSRGEKKA